MSKYISRETFVNKAKEILGKDRMTITRKEIKEITKKHKLSFPNWLTHETEYRAGRGLYHLMAIPSASFLNPQEKNTGVRLPRTRSTRLAKEAKIVVPTVPVVTSHTAPTLTSSMPNEVMQEISLIPDRANGYVPFGYYNDVKNIVASGIFYPVYITGLSGNGKTMMCEQVHADLRKEVIRVNITSETDEDDLLGGFRLVNGATVWQNGPVITAMERGCSLILDEVDLGSNKLMCLQPVLEGKGIFLKKINKLVKPAPGFNVFATANTKGKGSDDGRFIGTNVMNEAFLERFSVTLEQEYPPLKTETKILKNIMESLNVLDENFIKCLVTWADNIRESYKAGAITEIISTRRLVHIVQAFAIFNQDRKKAITLCLNRFDDDTKSSMLQLYEKIDESMNPIKTDDHVGQDTTGVKHKTGFDPADSPF